VEAGAGPGPTTSRRALARGPGRPPRRARTGVPHSRRSRSAAPRWSPCPCVSSTARRSTGRRPSCATAATTRDQLFGQPESTRSSSPPSSTRYQFTMPSAQRCTPGATCSSVLIAVAPAPGTGQRRGQLGGHRSAWAGRGSSSLQRQQRAARAGDRTGPVGLPSSPDRSPRGQTSSSLSAKRRSRGPDRAPAAGRHDVERWRTSPAGTPAAVSVVSSAASTSITIPALTGRPDGRTVRASGF